VSLSRTEAGRCVLSTRLVELNRVIYWRVTADVSPDFGQVVRICSTKAGRVALTSASRSEAGDGRTSPVGTDKASAITALMMWATRKAPHMT